MTTDRLPESNESLSDYDKPPSVKKRKYRKHPKPDPNAPKKPSPSAYHLFALEQGNRLRKDGYCFEDIARETGAMWRALPPQTVNELESKTTQAKNQYRKDVSSYKKSTNYREYQEYLKRWMAKEEAKKKRAEASLSSRLASPPPRKRSPAIATNPLSPLSTGSASTSTADELPALDLPSSNSPHSSTSSFLPSSTNSINADSALIQPMKPTFASSADDQDAQAETEDDWFLSNSLGGSMSMHLHTPVPELSIREQLEWKWSADFDATLAPDPLYPLMPSRSSQQLSNSFSNNTKGNADYMLPELNDGSLSTSSPWLSSSSFSTVSPSMLSNVGVASPFLPGAAYPFTFGSNSTGFRRRGGYGIDSAAC